jgi:hypothetical protein
MAITRIVRAITVSAFVAAGGGADAGAQMVRGVVREGSSGTLVPGVVVSLDRADSAAAPLAQTAVSVLSNERAEYAVRAAGPGRYFITAKRIGVRRFVSEPFELAAGETRVLDVTVDALLYTLPEVVVNVHALCAARRTSMQRLAALWDEARSALTATQISVRDSLFRTNVTRYVLSMDAASLKVLSESWVTIEGAVARPFASLSGDSLAQLGYWRELPGDSAVFYGPDAEVLLSDAFRQGHCFSVVEGNRTRRGLVGLAFEPPANQLLPDVRGTFWLDARSFELRFIEFGYTRLPSGEFMGRVGGEVHFARVPSGAWIVRRWSLRMPQYARYSSGPRALPQVVADAFNAAPPSVARLMEEGAMVEAEGLRDPGSTAEITGAVLDSVGRPFVGASVRLAGQRSSAPVDARGRFRLANLTPGTYSLIAEHPGYTAFGMPATSAFVALAEGDRMNVDLRATRSREIIPRLCNGLPPIPPRATLRLVLVDSATKALVTGVPLVVSWSEAFSSEAGSPTRERTLRATTDLGGAASFCNLPPGIPIELAIERPNNEPQTLSVFGLGKNQVSARLVSILIQR